MLSLFKGYFLSSNVIHNASSMLGLSSPLRSIPFFDPLRWLCEITTICRIDSTPLKLKFHPYLSQILFQTNRKEIVHGIESEERREENRPSDCRW